jgi:hypothetical protein
MTPEVLVGMLAELEKIRSLTIDLVERQAPHLVPAIDPAATDAEHAAHDLLLGARRAVLGNPAAARHLHDLLVAEGHRYAATPEGLGLRDRLVASEAVENLRRVWETLSLNVLDGPATSTPTGWAELLADAIVGNGLDDAILARLRPEGFS